MPRFDYPDALLARVLTETRTIAVVGASDKPSRPSNGVMRFLAARGYGLIPVNPRIEGQTLLGATVRESLSAIPAAAGPVQMVDIFRRADQAGAVVDEALAALAPRGLRFIWMQLGVIDEAAAARAEAAGLTVIMDRCPKIEHRRLFPAET